MIAVLLAYPTLDIENATIRVSDQPVPSFDYLAYLAGVTDPRD
jgi:hypothetical protein